MLGDVADGTVYVITLEPAHFTSAGRLVGKYGFGGFGRPHENSGCNSVGCCARFALSWASRCFRCHRQDLGRGGYPGRVVHSESGRGNLSLRRTALSMSGTHRHHWNAAQGSARRAPYRDWNHQVEWIVNQPSRQALIVGVQIVQPDPEPWSLPASGKIPNKLKGGRNCSSEQCCAASGQGS